MKSNKRIMSKFDARTNEIFRLLDFEPTGQEQEDILACSARFILVSGGDQSGKSTLAGAKFTKELPADLLRAKKNGWPLPLPYWIVGIDYARTQKEFEYIKENMAKLGLLHDLGTSKRFDPGRIEIKGELRPGETGIVAVVKTISGDDITKMAMESPSGIILAEAALLSYDAFLRCMIRAAGHRAWLFLSGSMEPGSIGWYPNLRKEWEWGHDDRKAFSIPSYSNWHLYPGGRDDPEIQRIRSETGDAFFMERIEGVPCPPKGLVMPEFNVETHVRDLSYTPGEPVHLWVDPGYRHHCAVEVVQIISGQVRVVDEVFERGLVVQDVIEICRGRPWWKDVAHGVIDIAAWAHAGQQTPAAEIWAAPPPKGAGLYMRSNRVAINEGTDVFRGMLKVDPLMKQPRMVVSWRARGLLSELGIIPNPLDNQVRVYQWKLDRAGQPIGKVPDDRYNDAIKAVIYGLVDNFGYSGINRSNAVAKVVKLRGIEH